MLKRFFEKKVDCPKDLIEWANSDPLIIWYLYDVNLLPEQIHNIKQVCALRGFKFGWECCKLASRPTPRALDAAAPSYTCGCGFIVAVGETECARCKTPRQ